METLLIDVLLVITICIMGYFGWQAGFTRCFFATLAGFLAILAATKYPNQGGLNFYLIFAITAVVVFIIGGLSFRVINFIYLTVFDRLGGFALGAFVWTIVAVNLVIPIFDKRINNTSGERIALYRTIDASIRTHIPIFKRNPTGEMLKNIEQKVDSVEEKFRREHEKIKTGLSEGQPSRRNG